MRDKVFMSPRNGALVVAKPLFAIETGDEVISGSLVGEASYSVGIFSHTPVAYAIDFGTKTAQVLSAEWVEKKLVNLGDL